MFYHNHLIREFDRYLGQMNWYTFQLPGRADGQDCQPSEIMPHVLGKDDWSVQDQLPEHQRPSNSTENRRQNQVEVSRYRQHSACRPLRCLCEHTPVPSPLLFEFENQNIFGYLLGRIEDNTGDKTAAATNLDILPAIRLRSCLPVDKTESAKCQS